MASKLDSSHDDGINEINITPFVDVVLVLLVIFMVTAPVMIQESLKVNLPKTLTSDIGTKAATVGIAITKEGQVVLAGKILAPQALNIELARYSKEAADTNFLISADTESRHGDVIKMIDLLKRNNLNRFALQVEKIKDI
jgi:biopolymer transport protein ExbD